MNENLLLINEVLLFNIIQGKSQSREFILVKNNNLNKIFLIHIKLTNRERYIVNPITSIVKPLETKRIEIKMIFKENEKIEEIDTKKDIFVLLSVLKNEKKIEEKNILKILEQSDNVKKQYYRVKVNKIQKKRN